jgi:predicted O-linked N-acetylglucosamine transferase (SPINDLY family)
MELRQLFEQGVAAHRAGRLDQAEDLYRQVLRADAASFPALHMLGYLKAQQGRYDDAIVLLSKAVRKNSADPSALAHYAHALMAAQRFNEALPAYDRLLAIQPAHFEAHYNRGVILSQQRKYEEALASLDQALKLQPNSAAVHFNRGVVLAELERHREALESYDRVLALNPGYAPALTNRAMVALSLCDWDRAAQISADQAVMLAPPLTLLGMSDDKGLQLACASATVRTLAPTPVPPLWTGERYRHDRIRLAYVSPDFREHAVAFQLAPLVERHDRSRFQVIGISTGLSDESAIRARLMKAFDRFHDFAAVNSDDIARRLREMEIDIAIDLGGHTGLSRLQIFSHRPAPVQVSWLGYPGTTGAPFMDYLIADETVAPPEDQPFYTEKLVQLPDTYFPTDPARPIGAMPSRADEGLPVQSFVFCAFNNAWKITRPVFDIWMRLLAEVPQSVLWLKQPPADTRVNLEREAAARGIAPARLVFADNAPLDVHLARHRLADLFLDTLPYNAHATAGDALWAGLPVLTCRGDAFAGRVAASLLSALGMRELVMEDLADYEAMALSLARDPARLKGLKDRLAQNLPNTPLFDADRFRRNIEDAYVRMLDSP